LSLFSTKNNYLQLTFLGILSEYAFLLLKQHFGYKRLKGIFIHL